MVPKFEGSQAYSLADLKFTQLSSTDTAGTGRFWRYKLRPHFAASIDTDSEWCLPKRAPLKDVALD